MPAAPEGLVLLHESAYGTPVLTAGAVDYTTTTRTFAVRLPDSNAWTGDFMPDQIVTPFGGGHDVAFDVSVGRYECKATLTTFGYPLLTAFLCDAAITRVNSGQTAPWTTTEPQYDLASIAAYHYIRRHDGTVKRRKFTGGKIQKLSLSCSSGSPRLAVKADIVFQRETGNSYESTSDPDATEFPFPADTNFEVGPYLHQQTAGFFKLASTAITAYDSFQVDIDNVLDPRWFEGPLLYSCRLFGRKVTFSADVLYKATPDLRAAYQTSADRAFEIKWSNGSKTTKLDFGSSNHLSGLTFDLPLGKERMQKLTGTNRWNASSAIDVVVTNT